MDEFQIVCLGELLIDMVPGETGVPIREVKSFLPKPGGAPANVAVAASRLGAKSAFIGKVGTDHFGRFLAEVLEGEGVDIRGLRFDPEVRTTLAIIALPEIKSAEFVFYRNPGADQKLRVDELDRPLLESGKVLHFGSLSLTDEPSRSATKEAIRIARGGGALISCDFNYRPALWADPAQALIQIDGLFPEINLLKVNEDEAAMLTGLDQLDPDQLETLEQAAAQLLEKGPALVVITLGDRGSYFKTREGGGLVGAFFVDSVDTVGCGDAFVAGLLTRVSSHQARDKYLDVDFLRSAVRYANAVGALTSLKQGAIPALPHEEQVREFLADRGDDVGLELS